MDLNFQYSAGMAAERKAFRANIPGLSVVLPSGLNCPVKDLGVGGVGFIPQTPDPDCVAGAIFTLDLLVSGYLYLNKITAKVVRVTPEGLVACAFWEISRHHEDRLDKLILEMQKRVIARRKEQEQAAARASAGHAGGETPQTEGADSSSPIPLDSPF